VVRVAVSTVVAAGDENAANIRSSGDDQVKCNGERGCLDDTCWVSKTLEEGVADAQAVLTLELEQSLTVLLDLPPPEAPEANCPSLIFSTTLALKSPRR
jgi:hypothetical protein